MLPTIVAIETFAVNAKEIRENENRSPFDTTTPYRLSRSHVPEIPEQKEILSGKERRRKRRGGKKFKNIKR